MFPLVTEISPIFGLTLLGLIELLTIVIAVSSLVVAVIIGVTHWRQQAKQNKITSASLVLKWFEEWDKNTSFSDMMLKLEKRNAKFTDENDDVHFCSW